MSQSADEGLQAVDDRGAISPEGIPSMRHHSAMSAEAVPVPSPSTEAPEASPIAPVTAPATPPPTPGDVAWVVAISAAKATVVALAIDAFVNSDSPRYSGKGMRIRAIGYAGGLLVVPLAWRLVGRPQPYPRELDLAVTVPLLIDAGGNAVGLYRRAHMDDLIHFIDGAIVASVAGALATPRVRTSWEAAGVGALAGTAAAGLWEIAEWIGMKLGARGMDLSYDDAMIDLAETSAGALLGGVITLLRHPTRLRRVPGRRADPVVSPTA
jgi:hypothetical protein